MLPNHEAIVTTLKPGKITVKASKTPAIKEAREKREKGQISAAELTSVLALTELPAQVRELLSGNATA